MQHPVTIEFAFEFLSMLALFALAVGVLRLISRLSVRALYVFAPVVAVGIAALVHGVLAPAEGAVGIWLGVTAVLLAVGRHQPQSARQSLQDAPRTTNAPSMN